MSSLLPIFPLDLVLLPGAPLPLHIFEPRYKEMISECVEQKKPFGVVRASDEGVAGVGCTAEIVSVTKKYDDGRMDILTRGVERFEVVEVNEERAFLRAEISLIQDEDDNDDENDAAGRPEQSLIEQAVRLHAEIIKIAGAELSEPDETATNLSFLLAGSLPLDLDFKQNLLTTLSETKRLEAVVGYLEAVLPGLRRAAKARWN
ncbi:MAG: LON peptidase substrate-binding domain-containing protein [Terriglobales bacterium]